MTNKKSITNIPPMNDPVSKRRPPLLGRGWGAGLGVVVVVGGITDEDFGAMDEEDFGAMDEETFEDEIRMVTRAIVDEVLTEAKRDDMVFVIELEEVALETELIFEVELLVELASGNIEV